MARHDRCFNRQQKVLNLEHYLEALTQTPTEFVAIQEVDHRRFWVTVALQVLQALFSELLCASS